MIVVAEPLLEPVSLAEVKDQLGIQDTRSDALISRRIAQARKWAENYTRRAFITQTRELRWDCFPVQMELPSALSVVSVKYIDNDGVLQTVSYSDYVLDTYDEKLPVLKPVYDAVWPVPRDEENAVRVQFTAGFGPKASDVDPLIKEAIILLAGHWTNNQPQGENGITPSRVPFAVRDLLDPFSITRYL